MNYHQSFDKHLFYLENSSSAKDVRVAWQPLEAAETSDFVIDPAIVFVAKQGTHASGGLRRRTYNYWVDAVGSLNKAHDFYHGGAEQVEARRTWRRRVNIYRAIESFSSVPDALVGLWFRLGQSRLPARVYEDLLAGGISSEQKIGNQRRQPLSRISLSVFLDVWEAVREVSSEPVVSVNPAGFIVAEWYKDSENSLVLMVSDAGDVVFSLFYRGEELEDAVAQPETQGLIKQLLKKDPTPFSWSDAE